MIYDSSTLDLSPHSKALIIQPSAPNASADHTIDNINNATTAVGIGSSVVKKGASLAQKAIPVVAEAVGATANAASTASQIATTAGEVASALGPAASVAGGVVSGIGLGFNINDAVKEKQRDGKVSFNTAMNIADNATGVVSAAANFIPVVGTGISIALSVGEKVVTGIIKMAKAVSDEKKRQGVKHLSASDWWDTTMDAIFPHWMTTDFKTLSEEHKAKKEADRREIAREVAVEKQAMRRGGTGIMGGQMRNRSNPFRSAAKIKKVKRALKH
jgi:hypothetical protein